MFTGSHSTPDDLYSYVVAKDNSNPASDNNKHKYMCAICGRSGLHRADVRNHVENLHFPGVFAYTCTLCRTVVKSKTALLNHKALKHKNNGDQIIGQQLVPFSA